MWTALVASDAGLAHLPLGRVENDQMFGARWLEALSDDQFELLKIVVDKGALAALVAIVGFVFALLMERYKAYLVGRTELLKFAIPKIQELMRGADGLRKDALAVKADLTDRLTPWQAWIKNLDEDRRSLDEGKWPPLEEKSDVILAKSIVGGGSIGSHLRDHANALGLQEDFKRIKFPDDSLFLRHLTSAYRGGPLRETSALLLEADFRRHLFRYVTAAERSAFRDRANQFMLDTLTVVFPLNRTASTSVSELIGLLTEDMADYPYAIATPPGMDQVTDTYFGIISQLSRAITHSR